MTTAKSQKKWRDKHRFVKTQLNVMARTAVHQELAAMAETFICAVKGEAVSFAVFLARALIQRAEFSTEAARLLDDATAAFHRDRDVHSN